MDEHAVPVLQTHVCSHRLSLVDFAWSACSFIGISICRQTSSLQALHEAVRYVQQKFIGLEDDSDDLETAT